MTSSIRVRRLPEEPAFFSFPVGLPEETPRQPSAVRFAPLAGVSGAESFGGTPGVEWNAWSKFVRAVSEYAVPYADMGETADDLYGVILSHVSEFHVPKSWPAYHAQDLEEALADFDRLGEMALEDELPRLDEGAVANARTLLPKLHAIYPARYHVQPTERGGVSLDPPMKHSRTVSIECAPNDAVYCFAVIDGNARRAKFYQMDGLPDVFMRKALHDLAGE